MVQKRNAAAEQNNQKSSSHSETGHAKNVANFGLLIAVVKNLKKYKPNKQRFTIAGLEAMHQAAKGCNGDLTKAAIALGNLISQRQELFAPLPKTATRIMNALADTDASDGFIKDAQTINRKIQGRRATPVKKSVAAMGANGEPLPTAKTISISQQSFDSMEEHFKKFLELLSTESSYTHADETISLPGVQTLTGKMEAVNTAVKNGQSTFGDKLRSRNELLYQEKLGMVETAKEVKKLVRSAYGSRSPEAAAVSAIEFKIFPKLKL